MSEEQEIISIEMPKAQWLLIANMLDAAIMQRMGVNMASLGSEEMIAAPKGPQKVDEVTKNMMIASEKIMITLYNPEEL